MMAKIPVSRAMLTLNKKRWNAAKLVAQCFRCDFAKLQFLALLGKVKLLKNLLLGNGSTILPETPVRRQP